MRSTHVFLILIILGSSLGAEGQTEDCLEYSLPGDNQQVAVNDLVLLMEIRPYQPIVNSTLTEEKNEVKVSSSSPTPPGRIPSSPSRGSSPWKATAFIEDSRGSWCNMTISESSIKVFCSSGASGNHSSNSETLFPIGQWKKILLQFNAQMTSTGRSNETNITEVRKSGTAEMSSSFSVGLQGLKDHVFVVEEANISLPLTLRWENVHSGLKVIYNCWNGCVRSTRLDKTPGSRPFYLLKLKDFQGINITFTVLGEITRYQILTSEDFGSYDMRRWIPVSLRRESTSLKVFLGYNEIKDITNITSTILTSMEVVLLGGGSITWCDLTSAPSNALLIIVWTVVAGFFLLATYSVWTTIKAHKILKEWKENKDLGVKIQFLPPLEIVDDNNLMTRRSELTARRIQYESVNSTYDSTSLLGESTETKAITNRVNNTNDAFVTDPNDTLAPEVDNANSAFIADPDDTLAPEEQRTSCIVIPEAGSDEDMIFDFISTCSTDLPIAISTENNFDLDSTSSIELPRAIRERGDERSSSSSIETASSPMLNDAHSHFAANVRKRLQLPALSNMQSTASESDLLSDPKSLDETSQE
ncbi:uncharacterized protein LOC135223582 [Macrobrachium nipponense]|uniref:uncharacterized protein LOC135223582 n=1 Tax=Macrobrachium nipponense TaxID=159736 RepID=UPI0030C85D10